MKLGAQFVEKSVLNIEFHNHVFYINFALTKNKC